MVQRINFDLLTNLGGVADPALAQDAATKNYVDTNSGTVSLEVLGVYSPAVIAAGPVVLATSIAIGSVSTIQVQVAGSSSANDLANFFNNLPLSQFF